MKPRKSEKPVQQQQMRVYMCTVVVYSEDDLSELHPCRLMQLTVDNQTITFVSLSNFSGDVACKEIYKFDTF